LRRASSLVVLIALGLLALPTTALGARTAGSDSKTIVVVSGDVTVPRGETVDGIVVVSGDVHLAGRSEGDVVLVSGDAVVSGRIEGDLVTIAGRAHLLPRAYVSGDVIYSDEKPLVSGAAAVRGDIKKENWPGSLGFLPFIGAFLFWLAIGISAAILGVLLMLIAPRAADAVFARSRERVGPVIAIGIAIAICLPVAAVIAAITLVGLPLAIGVALALLPLGAVAYVASAWALGRRIVKPPRGRIVAFLAGLAILRAAALVPVLGLLVSLAASVFGLGLIGAAIGAARAPRQPAPIQSPGN
jgi:cytoskeletal protein CcmA (bactofilin family)